MAYVYDPVGWMLNFSVVIPLLPSSNPATSPVLPGDSKSQIFEELKLRYSSLDVSNMSAFYTECSQFESHSEISSRG